MVIAFSSVFRGQLALLWTQLSLTWDSIRTAVFG